MITDHYDDRTLFWMGVGVGCAAVLAIYAAVLMGGTNVDRHIQRLHLMARKAMLVRTPLAHEPLCGLRLTDVQIPYTG